MQQGMLSLSALVSGPPLLHWVWCCLYSPPLWGVFSTLLLPLLVVIVLDQYRHSPQSLCHQGLRVWNRWGGSPNPPTHPLCMVPHLPIGLLLRLHLCLDLSWWLVSSAVAPLSWAGSLPVQHHGYTTSSAPVSHYWGPLRNVLPS